MILAAIMNFITTGHYQKNNRELKKGAVKKPRF